MLNPWRDADLYRVYRKNCLDNLPKLRMIRQFGKPHSTFSRRFNTQAYASTLTPDGLARAMLPEVYGPDGLPRVSRPVPSERRKEHPTSQLERLHLRLISIHGALLRNPGWTLALLAGWLLSFVRVLQTGFRHRGAFTLFSLTSAALLYGFLVALLSLPILRYTFALEFVYYLSPLIWPIALGLEEGGGPARPDVYRKTGA